MNAHSSLVGPEAGKRRFQLTQAGLHRALEKPGPVSIKFVSAFSFHRVR
jgi:hypothetical protein